VIKIKYTIKNDVIFNYLFSHEDILKEFLEACLGKNIEKVEVTNQFSLDKVKYQDKVGVLDIRAKINKDKLVDIEMQRNKERYYIQRVLLYTGGFIRGQLKAGDKYEDLKDVIMINILNFDLFKEIDEVHTVWKLREEKHPELGTLEGLEIHFIELEKFRNSNPDFNEKINQWLALIDTENERWLEVAMSENKKVKEAKSRVDNFMSEDEARELAELREKWQLDYDSSISYATKRGYEEGLAAGIADGRLEGHTKGHAEGRVEGRAEGNLEASLRIAKKLIKKNSDLQEIVELTGLSESEILKLKK
jgi:predicted transposase/invertase (TIGR01784 family)